MANILILGFVLFCLGMACYRLPSFIMNRQYIQMEMKRAETEREYRHWKREMRRLYIEIMPFLRIFIK